MKIRLASELFFDSIVDGPGLRMVVWVQGCIHNCYKCHNPETHNFDGGIEKDTNDIINEIKKLKLQRGITLSGGEPFLQSKALAVIAEEAKLNDLDVWCYTGYRFEQLMNRNNPLFLEHVNLLHNIDVLVDGKFDVTKKRVGLKFKGSSNQRIIDVKKSLEKGCIILKNEYEQIEMHIV